MELTVTNGGVPSGSYVGRFVGVEKITNDYGAGLSWKWEVTEGPFTGKTVCRLTSPNPTLRNLCGRILSGLHGKPLSAGETFDVNECVGRQYVLIVTQTDKGISKVDSLTPIPEPDGGG